MATGFLERGVAFYTSHGIELKAALDSKAQGKTSLQPLFRARSVGAPFRAEADDRASASGQRH